MKKVVFTFGLIAGVIVSTMLILTTMDGVIDLENGELIGYTTMIIALSTIFVGIRSYRDNYLNGAIKFKKAFLIGLYISLVASVLYVTTWMILLRTSQQDFATQYYEQMVIKLQESDQSQEEIDQQLRELAEFNEMYKKPVVQIGVTLIEILPVGLFITLVSAGILSRKKPN